MYLKPYMGIIRRNQCILTAWGSSVGFLNIAAWYLLQCTAHTGTNTQVFFFYRIMLTNHSVYSEMLNSALSHTEQRGSRCCGYLKSKRNARLTCH